MLVGFTTLVAAIIYGITTSRKNKQIRQLTEKFKEMSEHDELTSLYNRHALENYLLNQWTTICEEQIPISVAMMDVDFFKLYNDNYGHQAGDKVLKTVSEQIRKNCKVGDFAVRYGGEEFMIIMPETNKMEALERMQGIMEAIHKADIIHEYSKVAKHVTLSIGVDTTFSEENYMKMIHNADEALYEAKKQRNQIVAFGSRE